MASSLRASRRNWGSYPNSVAGTWVEPGMEEVVCRRSESDLLRPVPVGTALRAPVATRMDRTGSFLPCLLLVVALVGGVAGVI